MHRRYTLTPPISPLSRIPTHRLQWGFSALVFCLALSDSQAQQTCGTPNLLSPAHTDITNAKPRLEWTPVAKAKHYRLWLESRAPEGRVLFTHDIQTAATYWTPPAALTETRALVKVKLTAICDGDGERADATPVSPPFTRFRIDTSANCVLPSDPRVTLAGSGADISWPGVAGADYYELSVFSGVEAKLARKNESRKTRFRLDALSPSVWMIGVRPHCPSGFGAYRFSVLNLEYPAGRYSRPTSTAR